MALPSWRVAADCDCAGGVSNGGWGALRRHVFLFHQTYYIPVACSLNSGDEYGRERPGAAT